MDTTFWFSNRNPLRFSLHDLFSLLDSHDWNNLVGRRLLGFGPRPPSQFVFFQRLPNYQSSRPFHLSRGSDETIGIEPIESGRLSSSDFLSHSRFHLLEVFEVTDFIIDG